ncbi:MFS transporter [Paenibacillus sp. P26]|nr:MFS transporter [Paenibacillus sp. P26]
MQNIRGFTAFQSGLLMLPGAILMGIMSPISGALFDRIGARPLAVVGLIITALTTYQFSFLTSETPYSHILLLYTVRNFGISMLMMTVQTAGLNQIPLYLSDHATAMSNTMRQIAGSIGTALLVTVMTSRSTVHMGIMRIRSILPIRRWWKRWERLAPAWRPCRVCLPRKEQLWPPSWYTDWPVRKRPSRALTMRFW